MNEGLVSIVIPCYNGEKFLKDALDALLMQTYRDIEVIVVDDGSTDSSSSIIKKYIKYFDERGKILRYIFQNNAGQASAMNTGLKEVHGEFLLWQDADDYYSKNAVEIMVGYMKAHPNLMIARGEVNYIDEENGAVVGVGKSNNPHNENVFDSYVFETDSYCFPGIFITRMKYFDSRIKDRKIYESRAGQNWQLILPLVYGAKCGYIDKVIYNYRITRGSHSRSVAGLSNLLKRCDSHEDVLISTIKKIDEMSDSEKEKYIRRIKRKYKKKKIMIRLHSIKRKEKV